MFTRLLLLSSIVAPRAVSSQWSEAYAKAARRAATCSLWFSTLSTDGSCLLFSRRNLTDHGSCKDALVQTPMTSLSLRLPCASPSRRWRRPFRPLTLLLAYSLESSSVMSYTRRESGRGDILIVDHEELEEMDASEIHARLNVKEVILPKSGENWTFPVADRTVQPHGGDWGECREDFLDESKGSPPTTHFQDSYPDGWSTWWILVHLRRPHIPPSRWTNSQTLHAERRVISYIDVTRVTHTTVDVLQECRIDYCWNIDGSRDLSDSWKDFRQFTLLKGNPPEGYMWSGRD